MSVNQSIEGKSIRPASGEVQNIDLIIRLSGLSHPAQEDFFTVCLLQV